MHAHSPKTLRVSPITITRKHRDLRIVLRRKTFTRRRINLTVLLSCFTNINGLVHVGVPLGNELRPTEELQARSNRRFAFAHLAWLVNGSIYIRTRFRGCYERRGCGCVYLVPVLASCGYRYIHKSTTFRTEENTAPQRVCNCLSYKKQWFSIKIYYRDCRVVAILCVALI